MKKIEISENLGSLIVERYNQCKSTYQTAIDVGMNRNKVYRYLKEIGHLVDGYTGPRRSQAQLNDNFFSIIDTEVKAYWLGFFAADGNVRKTKRGQYHVSLHVARKDESHLELFKKHIGSSHKIQRLKNNGYPSSKICISRKIILESLCTHGVVPCKTFVLDFPSWLGELSKHWLRGYFDGDGSWYTRKNRKSIAWSLVGVSPGCLHEIRSLLSDKCGIEKNRITVNKDGVFKLGYEGINICSKLYDFMYKDATVWLDRKRIIANKYLDLDVVAVTEGIGR